MKKLGEKIFYFRACSSTNDLAKEKAEKGEEEGVVFWAEEQLKGRGREGRTWYSAKSKGLYFSIILRPESESVLLLPLLAGICCAEAINELFQLKVELKWPNDILCQNKKLGGILAEASFKGEKLNYLVLGIGLNTNYLLNDFPEEFRAFVTSLKIISGKEFDNRELLKAILNRLNYWYNLFSQRKKKKLFSAFNKYSFFKKEQRIKIKTKETTIEGNYKGIDQTGALVLSIGRKEIKVYSGEVT
ncbi:MAG: biotin--[acetyl-CoA-carboxylase] ligase [Candidatus Aminicenantia bacterium]